MAETMTNDERVWAALLYKEKPDRVPVVPAVSQYTAAYYQGITNAQSHDTEMGINALIKTYDDLGGYDAVYLDLPLIEAFQILVYQQPMRWKVPGRDLPDDYINQVVEAEVLKKEDYDRIIEEGWDKFYEEDYILRITDWKAEDVPNQWALIEKIGTVGAEAWGKRGVQAMFGWGECLPFFKLSLSRSFLPFTEDLYFDKERVERAIKVMNDEMIPRHIQMIKESGINHILVGEERSSGYHYPPEIFERFWMPYSKKMVEAYWDEGIFTTFHLDTDFTKNLESFKQLPKGSFCLHFDSTTDMVNAKNVLRGHCSLMGDVPASLLSIGSPEEVEGYCQNLIDKVGDDGGFILNAGCECPADAKPENLRAMIETAKKSFY